MKHLKKAILAATILTALISKEAISATATGTSTANILTPISIASGTNIQFGSFTSSASAGTINQSGTVTGGVTSISSSTRSAGTFTVSGSTIGNTPYTFTLPGTVTLTSGANNMTASISFASGSNSRTLTAGSEVVSINGLLSVAANQASGSYTGTYTVTAIY